MVELEDVGHAAGGRTILDGVTLRFAPRSFTVVLGPNGAGKSTLLRIAAGLLRPARGRVLYDGRPAASFAPQVLARRRAVLSQHSEPAFPLSAGDVVELGRYPHAGHGPAERDREAVDQALDAVGMSGRRDQAFATLSAGERQLIHMARVLAQIEPGRGPDGRVLFLDEPTTSLDVRHQLQLLALARTLPAAGVAVIAVLHDLNHAMRFADDVVLLDGGRVVHAGPRSAGLPDALVSGVYRVAARRIRDPEDGRDVWCFGD